MLKAKVYPGRYVYHSIDTAAFFKVRELLDGGLCIIEQIDNLGTKANRGRLLYTVKIKDLKQNYI